MAPFWPVYSQMRFWLGLVRNVYAAQDRRAAIDASYLLWIRERKKKERGKGSFFFRRAVGWVWLSSLSFFFRLKQCLKFTSGGL
jgi:hypothetical protein